MQFIPRPSDRSASASIRSALNPLQKTPGRLIDVGTLV
jgi:hypothetical protein